MLRYEVAKSCAASHIFLRTKLLWTHEFFSASGVGDGCAELSEGNELIKALQERSAAKREQYAKVCFRYLVVLHHEYDVKAQ